MTAQISISWTVTMTILTFALMINPAPASESQQQKAIQILNDTGVKGGLIVHIGCGDGSLTSTLHANERYLVHGLDSDPRNVQKAREHIRSLGLYGKISIDQLNDNYLPYIDNTVNLIVSENIDGLPMKEIMRVLVPDGVAYIKDGDDWAKTIKPRPENIDEWTHYLHDASNNAVAHDTAIGPLRHLQWDSGPVYSRHHEYTSSVAAVVSSKGRLFSIMDMGSRASIHMPSKWRLTARDAFNGIKLWQQPIESWFNHLWPLKDGPAQPPRRLVAVGDSVYVTLGLEAPVSRLHAATGKILHTYEGTDFTEEILCSDGTLFLLKNDKSMNPKYYPRLMVCWDEKNRTMKESEGYLLRPGNRHIIAIDAETGKTLWNVEYPVEPLTLAAGDQGVYFHNWERIICLDRKTGEEKWQSDPIDKRKNMGYVYGPTLVLYDDVVLFADGRLKRKMMALSKKDGTLLWEAPHYPAGHAGSPEDLIVIDGLVWCGKIAGGNQSGIFTGRDPKTGQVKREFTPNVDTYWFHHRCYRAKATDEYFLASRTGIEFVDVRRETWETHHWVRGACTYGIVPCNGLIYAPPHPCACYLDSKLSGFCALAPERLKSEDRKQKTERLQKGPAYGQILTSDLSPLSSDSWPTYRHDMARSGATKTNVNLPLSKEWQVNLDGDLTSPVVNDGRIYVASKDTYTLYSLEAEHGKQLWTFIAGGEVDSPPTIYRGLVIFGCADGQAYCLRASDGALVWRFRAGPRDMRLVSYGRLESVWPIHGSVLVNDDIVYFVAGRSTFLDGGLRFYRLDARTGRMLSENVLNDQHSPQKDVKVLNMPTALPDVLSTDGELLYMRAQAFDLKGKRVQTLDPTLEPFERATRQLGRGVHLFSPTGFLDDNAWHRSYWVYGRAFSSGCNWWYRAGRYAPAGRILAFDDDRVYGFGREPGLFVWSHVLEHHLFCSARQADAETIEKVKQWSQKSGRDAVFNRRFTRQASIESRLAPKQYWSVSHPPLHARAMVLAGRMLFVAGPPDVLNEDEAFERPNDPKVKDKITEQDEAYEGRKGALLMGISVADGKQVLRLDLSSEPVWDGMAAANGRLYLSAKDGKVLCFDKQ